MIKYRMNIKNIIKEEIKKFIPNSNEIEFNQLMFKSLFDDDLSEGSENNKDIYLDVISKLKNNDFQKPNPELFYDNITNNKHVKMLTPYSVADLSNMKLFLLNGYNIGFALKLSEIDNKYSEIVAVFNNEDNVRGIGTALIQSAINNGGCHLDHFDGFLSNLYEKNGFIETQRFPYDSQYDKDGSFKELYGKADVIYRTHKSCLN